MSNKIKITKPPIEVLLWNGDNYQEVFEFLDGYDVSDYMSNHVITVKQGWRLNIHIGEYIVKYSDGEIDSITQEEIDKGWIVVSEETTPIEKGYIHVKQVRQSQFEAFVESYKLRQLYKDESSMPFSTNDERILSMIYVYTLVDSNNNPMAFYRNTPSWMFISHEPKLFWIKDMEHYER